MNYEDSETYQHLLSLLGSSHVQSNSSSRARSGWPDAVLLDSLNKGHDGSGLEVMVDCTEITYQEPKE